MRFNYTSEQGMIDKRNMEAFEKEQRGILPGYRYTEEERAAVTSEKEKALQALQLAHFTLEPHVLFDMYKSVHNDQLRFLSHSSGCVHSSPERVLWWHFFLETEYNLNRHYHENGISQSLYPCYEVASLNDHDSINYRCVSFPFPLQPRDFLNRDIFVKLTADSYLYISFPVKETSDLVPCDFDQSTLDHRVRGELHRVVHLERLPHEQTKLRTFSDIDAKGTASKGIVDSAMRRVCHSIFLCHEYFQRSDEVDRLERAAFTSKMPEIPISDQENATVLDTLRHVGMKYLGNGNFDVEKEVSILDQESKQNSAWKHVRLGSVSLQDQNFLKTFMKRGSTKGSWQARAVARVDTSAADALAWLWYTCSNFRLTAHKKEGNSAILTDYDNYDNYDNSAGRESRIKYSTGRESRATYSDNSFSKNVFSPSSTVDDQPVEHSPNLSPHYDTLRRILQDDTSSSLPTNNTGHTKSTVVHKSMPMGFEHREINTNLTWCELGGALLLAQDPSDAQYPRKAVELKPLGRVKHAKTKTNLLSTTFGFANSPKVDSMKSSSRKIASFKSLPRSLSNRATSRTNLPNSPSVRATSRTNLPNSPSTGTTSDENMPIEMYDTEDVYKQDSKKNKIVQLRCRGIWIMRSLAPTICEVTVQTSFSDEGKLPSSVLAKLRLKVSFETITSLRSYFLRNGLQIDREIRRVFVSRIPHAVVTDKLTQIVDEQMGKVKHISENMWIKLPSTIHVKKSKIYMKSANAWGKAANAWGKAETTLDSSAEDCLAWFWDYCSNERLSSVKNFRKNPRELVKSYGENHNIVSTIKGLPWPLTTRQFFYENTWLKRSDGSYVYAWQPLNTHENTAIDQFINMGDFYRTNFIQAETRGYVLITPETASSCKIAYFMQVNGKGNIPAKVVDVAISRMLGSVEQVYHAFNQDENVDTELRQELMKKICTTQDYTEDEENLVHEVMVHLRKSSIGHPVTWGNESWQGATIQRKSNKSWCVKFELIVDACAEECAAHNFMFMSRDRIKKFDRPEITAREATHVNNNSFDANLVMDVGFNVSVVRQLREISYRNTLIKKTSGDGINSNSSTRRMIVHVGRTLDKSQTTSNEVQLKLMFCSTYEPSECINTDSHLELSAERTISSFYNLESEIAKTKMKFVIELETVGGGVTPRATEKTIKLFLRDFCLDTRRKFCKDIEIDTERRNHFINQSEIIMESMSGDASDEELDDHVDRLRGKEMQLVMAASNFLDTFDNGSSNAVTLDLGDKMVTSVARVLDGVVWCKLSLQVHASYKQVFSFLMDVESRALQRSNSLQRRILETRDNTQVVQVIEEITDLEGGIFVTTHRTMTRKTIWTEQKKGVSINHNQSNRKGSARPKTQRMKAAQGQPQAEASNSRYILYSQPVILGDQEESVEDSTTPVTKSLLKLRQPQGSGLIRKEFTNEVNMSRVTYLSADQSSVEMLFRTTLPSTSLPGFAKHKIHDGGELNDKRGSSVPLGENLDIGVKKGASEVALSHKQKAYAEKVIPTKYDFQTLCTMQRYFQHNRSLADLDEEDGVIMGKLLMGSTARLLDAKQRSKKAKEDRLNSFFKEFAAMKELTSAHVFFETMIRELLLPGSQGKRTSQRLQQCSKLGLLYKSDGIALGASYLSYINMSATEEGAYKSLMRNFPVLSEFELKYRFFRPFMVSIGKSLRVSETWFKLFLCLAAAAAGILDVGSDIYSIWHYKNLGSHEVGNILAVFVSLSLFLQLMLVVLTHHKSGQNLAKEIFLSLTYTKNGVNWWRVMTDRKQDGHNLLTPVYEMMLYMVIEVAAESIPITVLQVYMILDSDTTDLVVVFATIISAAFVSETVSYLTYVKDVDEETREQGSIFFGFFPLSGIRMWIVCVALRLISFCQLLGKCVEIALLYQLGGKTLVIAVLSLEMTAYLLYKAIRRDFAYWLPVGGGKRGLFVSLVARVVMKLIADFTAMVHTRHPYELGGSFWLFNLVYTQASIFVVLLAKKNISDSNNETNGVDVEFLFTRLGIVFLVLLLSVVTLLKCSEKEFRHTFYSPMRAREYSRALFDSGDDLLRISVFADNPAFYEGYSEELKNWISENWAEWLVQKPKWFTVETIGNIPLDYIPHQKNSTEDSVADLLNYITNGGRGGIQSSENSSELARGGTRGKLNVGRGDGSTKIDRKLSIHDKRSIREERSVRVRDTWNKDGVIKQKRKLSILV